MKNTVFKSALQLLLTVFLMVIVMLLTTTSIYTQGGEDPGKPVITAITLDKTDVSGGTELTLTITAESNSPVNWVNKTFSGPAGVIYSGGSSRTFTEVESGVWEYSKTDFVSKHAPGGTYSYEDISVRNEGMETSDVWQETVSVEIETESSPEKPTITGVELNKTDVSGGIELTLTITVESNSPVNWVNKTFSGPSGIIYSGGSSRTFTKKQDGVWEYSKTDFVSEHAPGGTYSYEDMSVRNEGMKTSDVWQETVSVEIETESSPEKPVITAVDLNKDFVEGGTELTLTITAESNSPVNWVTKTFSGPSGIIYSGGSSRTFTKKLDGAWEYSKTDFVSKHAPGGTYSYEDISVRNEGMETSDVWQEAVNVNVNVTTGPEEKEVNPENGSATVNFPESDVVIVIETDESGTITVTRYPSDNKAPPAGQTAAGIFLNIVPSSSLQGKPATFTVGYETPLPDGIDESTLRLYRWSGSEWEPLVNQTLNTSDKTITATVEGFSTFGVFGSDDAVVDDNDEKFEEIVKRFNFSFVFSGLVEHEREIKLPGGVVQYVASGLGDLSGTQSGLTRESPIRKAINYQETYHSATDLEALHDQHMRTITEFEVGRDHAARTGVEPKPGETGYIKQSVESNVDKDGEYLKHNSHYGTSDGITRRVTEIGNEKTTIDVEGYSFGWETVTVEDGGDKTGWWDLD